MHRGWLTLLLLLWAFTANATTVSLDSDTAWPLSLQNRVLVLEDSTRQLGIADVTSRLASESERLIARTAANLKSGFTKSAVWLAFDVRNEGADPLPLRFIAGPGTIGRVDFYLEQDDRWTHSVIGESVPLDQPDRVSRLPLLSFNLRPGEHVRILARAESEKSLQLRPVLYSAQSYSTLIEKNMLWDHIYFGALVALAWCAFAISLFARRISLLVMGLLCSGTLLYEFISRGYAKIYLWPQAGDWASHSGDVVGHIVIAIYILTFYFLSKQEKISLPATQYLLSLAGLQCATALATLMVDYQTVAQVSPFLNLLTGGSMVAVAIVMKKKAVPTAGLMLLTNVFLMFRLILIGANRYGLNIEFLPAGSLGALIDSPIFTFAAPLINLTLVAAWINYVGKQRKIAHNALATWQAQEQHRLEAEVERQTRALSQALQYANENNRKQTETLSYISHDLRVPLATIVGYAQLLSETQTSAQKPHVEAIERSANYQLSLINELLEYTRNELQPLNVRPSPVAMKALLDDIKQSAVALSAQQNNEFQYEARTPLPEMAMLDGRRLQQVLLNLLANAAKFTRRGTISMMVSATRHLGGWSLRFTVADTGVGMQPDMQTDVFKAFTQLQPEQGGVGLGLFIARQIVETMGGELQVQSAPGIGSRFSFEIDVAPVVDTRQADNVTAAGHGGTTATSTFEPAPATFNHPPHNATVLSAYPIPPAHTRVELAIHARDGQLTDIEEWLRRMLETYPGFGSFLNEVQAALDTLDFEYIEALALSSDA